MPGISGAVLLFPTLALRLLDLHFLSFGILEYSGKVLWTEGREYKLGENKLIEGFFLHFFTSTLRFEEFCAQNFSVYFIEILKP